MCNRHHICLFFVCHPGFPSRKVPWRVVDPSGNRKSLRLCPGKVQEVGNPSRQGDHSGNMKKNLRLRPGKARQVGGWSRREVAVIGWRRRWDKWRRQVPGWCRKDGRSTARGTEHKKGTFVAGAEEYAETLWLSAFMSIRWPKHAGD